MNINNELYIIIDKKIWVHLALHAYKDIPEILLNTEYTDNKTVIGFKFFKLEMDLIKTIINFFKSINNHKEQKDYCLIYIKNNNESVNIHRNCTLFPVNLENTYINSNTQIEMLHRNTKQLLDNVNTTYFILGDTKYFGLSLSTRMQFLVEYTVNMEPINQLNMNEQETILTDLTYLD